MPRPVANPPNPWESTHVEYLGAPPPATLTVYEDDARSIISSNDSPDVPFRCSVNPCNAAEVRHRQLSAPSWKGDVLGALARDARCTVLVSIPFADETQARTIEALLAAHHRRLGFVVDDHFEPAETTFRRPAPGGQLGLFDG